MNLNCRKRESILDAMNASIYQALEQCKECDDTKVYAKAIRCDKLDDSLIKDIIKNCANDFLEKFSNEYQKRIDDILDKNFNDKD